MIDLSVCICSLEDRRDKLVRLLHGLEDQNDNTGRRAEILVGLDAGERTVGAKRQALLLKAVGRYICFVDDDDSVAGDYIQRILAAIKHGPDCVGFTGTVIENGQPAGSLEQYNEYGKKWHRFSGGFRRGINHLNPVRLELARMVGFADLDSGEDRDYAHRLRPLLWHEYGAALGMEPLYTYNLNTEESSMPAVLDTLWANRFGGDFELKLSLKSGGVVSVLTENITDKWLVKTGEAVRVMRAGNVLQVRNIRQDCVGWTTRVRIEMSGGAELKLPPAVCRVQGRDIRFGYIP